MTARPAGKSGNVFEPGVAPVEMIRDDFRALDSRVTLRTTYDVEQLVLMQTVEGHAHAGHGVFYGKRYPNTTLEDVSKALRLSPDDVKAERQCLIDEVREFVERVVRGEDVKHAVTAGGEPLLGIGYLRGLEIDPKGVLQGLYLGGLRDQAEVRKLAQEKFGVNIGYGKNYYINRNVMHRMGLNGETLSQQGHEHEIDKFKQQGLIVDAPDGDEIAYMYIRHHAGPGASDDAAIVMAGLLYGPSAAIGCFFADAMDTLEKFVPDSGDQDASIGLLIDSSGFNIGVTMDDAVDITYLAAVPEDRIRDVPDSSLRKLLSVDRKIDQCAIESHMFYVVGAPYAIQELDHGQCTNAEFYEYIDERLKEYKR